MQAVRQDSIINMMKDREYSEVEIAYECMQMAAPWQYYILPEDVAKLNFIATSIRYAGAVEKKLNAIKIIMEKNGFKRLAGGTNRIIFRCLEDPTIVAKVAIDRVGLSDNPDEMKYQHLLKPFCAKMFQITPCGTVGFAERVQAIKNRDEFAIIAPDVFDILDSLLGKYVMDDVGTKYFLNWGVTDRGPVLLDYPYVYELDETKLICKKETPYGPCMGFIDYDDGYNHLICQRCGKQYNAVDLKKNRTFNEIVKSKGGLFPMKTALLKNGKVIATNDTTDVIKSMPRNTSPISNKPVVKVTLTKGDVVVAKSTDIVDKKPVDIYQKAPIEPAVKASLSRGDEEVASNHKEDTAPVEEEVTVEAVEEQPEEVLEGSSFKDDSESEEISVAVSETEEPPSEMKSYYIEPPEEKADKEEYEQAVINDDEVIVSGKITGNMIFNDESIEDFSRGNFIPKE